MFKKIFAVAALTSLALTFGQAAQAQPVADTGEVITGARFNFRTGTWIIDTDQRVLHNSALDPNRDSVDPGSYQTVNYTKWSNGQLWHYTGARWTSFGVPHSTITRHAVSQTGWNNVQVNQSQTQYRGTRGNGQPQRSSNARSHGSSGIYDQW